MDISHLDDVIDVLKKCRFSKTRWLRLGLKLGLLKTTLDTIKKDNDTVDDCLMECLSKWLSKADNVVSRGGPPTWDSLSASLRAIDEIAVADQLDTEKRPALLQAFAILSSYDPASLSQAQSISDPVSVARLLCGEHVITGAVLANVESTGQSLTERRKVLLAAVGEAVQTNHQSLQTFGTVLCKVTGNVQLGKAILSDYAKAFPDSRNEELLEVSEEVFIGSPTVIKIPILQSMSHEFSSIRASFARMFSKFRQAFLKTPPPLDNLKDFLISFNSDLIPQLADANNLHSVLRLIEGECTLIDIVIVTAVVQEYEIKEAERYIEEYKATLKEFCESVSDQLCLKENFKTVKTPPPLQCETATYVFDWEPGERRLKDITDILSKTSGRLVKIQYIDTGYSIVVTCTFPHSFIGSVIAKAVEGLELLKKNGLIELTIGYCTIWKRGEDKEEKMEKVSQQYDYVKDLAHETAVEDEEIGKLTGQEPLILKGDNDTTDPLKADLENRVATLSTLLMEEKEKSKHLTKKLRAMEEETQQQTGALSADTEDVDSMYKTMNTKMSLEIEQLKSTLKAQTTELEQSLEQSREIHVLQEKISSLSVQLLNIQEEKQCLIKENKQLIEAMRGKTDLPIVKDLAPSLLEPSLDRDYTSMTDDGTVYWRGEYEGRPLQYHRPYGWYRCALKVKGKYKDDTWLGAPGPRTRSSIGEWPVAYHGTTNTAAEDIVREGFRLARPKRPVYGSGVYTSPTLAVAEMSAKSFSFNGEKYKIVFQNRVCPHKSHLRIISISEGEYWESTKHDVENDVIDVRPYGILLKRVS